MRTVSSKGNSCFSNLILNIVDTDVDILCIYLTVIIIGLVICTPDTEVNQDEMVSVLDVLAEHAGRMVGVALLPEDWQRISKKMPYQE